MSKRKATVKNKRIQNPKLRTGNGNKVRVERVQGIRFSNAAGFHNGSNVRMKINPRDVGNFED